MRGRFFDGAPSLLDAEEILHLYEIVEDGNAPDGDVLEVGAHLGGTTHFLAEANVRRGCEERVWAIDPYPAEFPNPVGRMAMCFSECSRMPNISLLCTTLPFLATVARRAFRFCLIDGDHTYDAVRADLACALAMVVHGGTIALHDVRNEPSCAGAAQVWEEIVACGGIPAEGGGWVPDGSEIGRLGILKWLDAFGGKAHGA